ncbi:winged helix-turn-helix transcriptional regulator [Streptomyces sp. NPDC085932]|uniref:winged helix-turn-helix transcriptional regulator n=1 Tax=Streptomyces sp. NPDC085932 TaxID=3365741 RepID=UPI0037D6C693
MTVGMDVSAASDAADGSGEFAALRCMPRLVLLCSVKDPQVRKKEGTFMWSTHTHVPDRVGADHQSCEIRDLLDRVGDKWSMLAMAQLSAGPCRYGELRRSIDGISQRMLTYTLRGLERDGLVVRKVIDSTPPAVEYALTSVGRSLLDQLAQLTEWMRTNRDYVLESRLRYDEGPARESHSGP